MLIRYRSISRAGNLPRALSHGWLRFLFAAGFLLFAASGTLWAQISPGPLSKAHESLSGSTQCTTCHAFGGGSKELKCKECHAEIASELATGKGLHAKFPNREQCAQCHSEHNGEDFQLIHWLPSLKGFDHSQTGYILQGKHAQVDCNKCHTAAHVREPQRSQIKMKDLNRTFLGLLQDCTTCHNDPHKGQLGQNCLQCHNFVDWKAAQKFDHNKTEFPLTGLHTQVACEKCHTPAAPGGEPRFSGIPFAKCSDCHSDPHHGAFPQSCETCHTTASWKKVPESQKFDHSKTKFPLLGKHAQVDCIQCHADGNFKKPVAFAACMDCHQDAHQGQFADRKDKGECASCHTVEGWKPSLFGVKEHAQAAYPLLGKHAGVACEKCHVPAGKETRYKIEYAKCTDCHQDVHGGQFAKAPYEGQCESCHVVKGFQPSTYSIAAHRKSRFPLEGAHLAVTCSECHTADAGGYAKKLVPYRFDDLTCTACHKDPHGGSFNDKMVQRLPDGRVAGCQACHTVKSWLELPSFDHSKTKFPLVGAHEKVKCEECHKPSPGEQKLTEASFKETPTRCAACHQDPHAGQFVKAGKPQDCGSCHNTQKWRPSIFNHETQTDFSLKGPHVDVACKDCHTGSRNIESRGVVFYRPTPRTCAGCHN